MGSPDCVLTMQLNSLTPVVCLLLVSACHSLGLEGLKEQKATREGKKQVGLPCKTIVTEECIEKEVPRFEEVCEWYSEECETGYVKHCENSREKRGVLQAILLTSAIASQNPATTEAPARVRCYNSPTTTCRHNHDGTIDGQCQTTYHRHCYLTPGAEEGAGVKVCRKVNLAKLEKVCAKVDTLFCWRWHAGILRDLFLNIFSPSFDIFF